MQGHKSGIVFDCAICTVMPKYTSKLVTIQNGLFHDQYNNKNVFSHCVLSLLLLPDTQSIENALSD